LTPDHNDLTQLWQAIQGLIAQKYITTAITKKVHGAGADFVDLNSAFAWLGQYIITPSGYVTFLVAPGRWTYTNAIEVNHANMNRVAIQGGALLGGSPSGVNMSVTGYGAANDGTAQIVYLRSIYATELSFTGGVSGFVVLRGGCTLRYLLITGSQSISTRPPEMGIGEGIQGWGSGIECYDLIYIDGCSFWGFGNCGWYIINGAVEVVTALSVALSFNALAGVYAYGGFVFAQPCSEFICTSATGKGFETVGNGVGIGFFGGFFVSSKVYVAGSGPAANGVGAIIAENGSSIWTTGGTVMMNTGWGISCGGGSTVLCENTSMYNNVAGGVICEAGVVLINNSSLSAHPTDIYAYYNGIVDAHGCALYDPVNPAINTEGNNGAWIVG
jgi:hypothetical protein